MIGFTRRRFLQFSPLKQHKKCCELLREAYKEMLQQYSATEHLNHYSEIVDWMEISPLEGSSLQALSDRFHWHLNLSDSSIREDSLLPRIRQGDRSDGEPAWPIAIYLDNIRSAHNVGSILRTVEAFSLGEVFFSMDTPKATHPQVTKTSMGASQWVKTLEAPSLDSLPRPLIALETSPDAVSLFSFIFPEVFTLAVGNEEYGCSPTLLKHADTILEIPLRGKKNSLNVANAFAIVASEISRQREITHG